MKQEFERLTMGSTHQTIYMPDVERFVVPVPPLEEQIDIDQYIQSETAKIFALKGKIEEHIEKLREYRTALISAAVTGKIDVREEV
jgi:type I restriction enzyme S subunit